MNTDTIAAIATPAGSGGIGIIRLSGPRARDIAEKIFGKSLKGPDTLSAMESHRVYHGYVFNLEDGHVIDEVLLIPMTAPRSYTAEDVVEIQSHAGPMVMRSILEQLLALGARLADPGEFTKRAFLNGRIDLTQAEAVADIIQARSSRALKLAASQGLGKLGEEISRARETLLDLLALVEVAIDFPEEAQELVPGNQCLKIIEKIAAKCQKAIALYDNSHFLRDGIKLAICGAPNVGKSSIMNRLLAKERSIVTAIPGTTRDLIEENLNISGIPFVISDTAGLHQTDDLVEKIGIERARKHIAESDLILLVKEAGAPLTRRDIEHVVPLPLLSKKLLILVINKIDLIEKDEPPDLLEDFKDLPWINISALNNQGIDNLQQMIVELAGDNIDVSTAVVPNLRHREALVRALECLEAAKDHFKKHMFADNMVSGNILEKLQEKQQTLTCWTEFSVVSA